MQCQFVCTFVCMFVMHDPNYRQAPGVAGPRGPGPFAPLCIINNLVVLIIIIINNVLLLPFASNR